MRSHLFISAPAGARLATYHWCDGPDLRPLVGWVLNPASDAEATPVISSHGVPEHLAHPSQYHDTKVMLPTATDSDFDAWAGKTSDSLEATVEAVRPAMAAMLRHTGRFPVKFAAGYVVAEEMAAAGWARWSDEVDDVLILANNEVPVAAVDDNVLALRVADLLQHARLPHPITPDVITFEMPHGNHGIAVVVDGGYSQEDAEGMVDFWRTVLRRTLDEVAKVDLLGVEAVGR